MPGLDGIQLCHKVRESRRVPIRISFTYQQTEKTGRRDGLSAGADDYITKPFDPQDLKTRLRGAERVICLQDQLVEAHESLRDLALRDPLTQPVELHRDSGNPRR